jgi:2-amino-4-hydroxy-6-hydroxymethyldihydropteridine diphosphokinase
VELAYIGLGSNLGDREDNLENALRMLSGYVKIMRRSPIYETEPLENPAQPKFLNCVAEIQTDLEPLGLLDVLSLVEKNLGRQKGVKYDPRIIDLDILFYGQRVIKTPGLIIPHPRIPFRNFVLTPLCDLVPDLIHPVLGKSIHRLREDLLANSYQEVNLYDKGD